MCGPCGGINIFSGGGGGVDFTSPLKANFSKCKMEEKCTFYGCFGAFYIFIKFYVKTKVYGSI